MAQHIKDLAIDSPAFASEGRIPTRHTKDGEDVSPPLRWSGVPAGTEQLALICHDPDAPYPYGFTHWVVYGIAADATGIPEGGGGDFTEGGNDFGDQGYGGPQPPEGHGLHHYYFWLYALSTALDIGPGLSRAELLERIADHVIEQQRLVGVFER